MPRKILPRVCKRMKILLSYAHEDFALAEKIAQAPRAAGHRVFFDKHNMVGSEDFNARIRDEINSSERFVFLLSRAALDPGGFTLTELRFARERWPGAAGAVLPVIIDKGLDLKEVPAYLTAVHMFQPEGNIPAETVAEIDKGASINGVCQTCVALAALLAIGVVGFAVYPVLWPPNVDLLPVEYVHFRPRDTPPEDFASAGAPDRWTRSPVTITLRNVAYAHRTDFAKRARVVKETIEFRFGEKAYNVDWFYFVDIRDDCKDWLCVQKNAGPETLEPGKTSTPRETMFLNPEGGLAWGDFIDEVMTAQDLKMSVLLRSVIEIPVGNSFRKEERRAECKIDAPAAAKILKDAGHAPKTDTRPVFLQSKCEREK